MRIFPLLPLAWLAACAGGAAPSAVPSTAPPARAAPLVVAREPAGAGPAVVAGPAVLPATWTLAQRVVPATGERAMVVSGHPLANGVGLAMLRRGGNAVDAAVATAFALAVVLPEAGNVGGGGFAVVRSADGAVHALDFRETAPGRATRDMFLDSAGEVTNKSVVGHLASGVPGSVAGLAELHRVAGSGRLAWADLLTPAIALAAEGHLVDSIRSAIVAERVAHLRRHPATRAQFLVNDRAPAPGTIWRQPQLARTLGLIARDGADAFYRGPIAELIEQEMERGGGLITREDLAAYRPHWREPLALRYRGHTILTVPPSSGGGVLLGLVLNIMEGYDTLPPLGSAALLHLETEAMRHAFTARDTYLGDPDFMHVPLDRLMAKPYADSLRAAIDVRAATPAAGARPPAGSEGTETIHLAVVDSAGNAVSLTTTINDQFGSGVTVTGAGFLLNDEMDDFTALPMPGREANTIAPGKRMLSSMTPAIVLDPRGDVLLLVGGRGGTRIPTGVYRVIANVVDHGMALPEAVAAPRAHRQERPDSIQLEHDGFAPLELAALSRLGHRYYTSETIAQVNAILRTAEGWIGVGDPRGGGAAAGW